jgi:hypothetical protein
MPSSVAFKSLLALLALLLTPACNCGGIVELTDAGPAKDGGNGKDAGATDAGADAGSCIPPDVLIALDRTLTMHRMADGTTPADTDAGHALSKWSMAINGIEQLTAPPFDQGLRFGLELWPKQEPGCVTLAQRIGGTMATNPSCEGPEIVIDPALGTGTAIASLLDPETTPICTSTPTGAALVGARTYLAGRTSLGKRQFVVLVTDGADWDFSCPNPNPLQMVDELGDAGISTIIVGFSAEASLQNGVGAGVLNDMACAGGVAKGFPGTCAKNDGGFFRAANPDAGPGNTLFYVATNAAELASGLRAFAKTVCCDCIN